MVSSPVAILSHEISSHTLHRKPPVTKFQVFARMLNSGEGWTTPTPCCCLLANLSYLDFLSVSLGVRLGSSLHLYSSAAVALLAMVVCLASAEATAGKLFFMRSTTSDLDQLVGGYWEYEGDAQDSLVSVLDQISQGCGLNSSYVMMKSGPASSLKQIVQSGICESSELSVTWDQVHMSQFDPESPITVLNILNSVREINI